MKFKKFKIKWLLKIPLFFFVMFFFLISFANFSQKNYQKIITADEERIEQKKAKESKENEKKGKNSLKKRKKRTELKQSVATEIKTKKKAVYKEQHATDSNEFANLKNNLEQKLANNENEFAISFYDLQTKTGFDLNGSKQFFSASLNKVPICMLISDQVAQKKINWNDLQRYQEHDYAEGTGLLQERSSRDSTISDLISYAIRYSDNIARLMLVDRLGGNEEQVFQDIFTNYLPDSKMSNNRSEFSSHEYLEILKKLEQGKNENTGYQNIIDLMSQTVFNNRLETSLTTGHLAHKIGSYESLTHDAGFFFCNHPYILVILSNGKPDDNEKTISELSNLVWLDRK